VDAAFSEAVVKAIYEIRRYEKRLGKNYQVLRGDARELIPTNEGYDLTVFSPPYPNSFDYTDVYNVELWVCGYLHSSSDNRELRLSTLRSHVQIKRSFDAPVLNSLTLERVASELDEVRAKLWDQDIPAMVSAYFADMNGILTKLHDGLIPGGRAYVVVGDSQYAGVRVPVAQILNELALAGGFQVAGEEPFRSMRASPQQGGRQQLAESGRMVARVAPAGGRAQVRAASIAASAPPPAWCCGSILPSWQYRARAGMVTSIPSVAAGTSVPEPRGSSRRWR
jgi:hypothetical protein